MRNRHTLIDAGICPAPEIVLSELTGGYMRKIFSMLDMMNALDGCEPCQDACRGRRSGKQPSPLQDIIDDIDMRLKRLEEALEPNLPEKPDEEDCAFEDVVLARLDKIDDMVDHLQEYVNKLNTSLYKLTDTIGKD